MKRLFGGIFVAVGVLMMTGSGLCTIRIIIGALMGGSNSLTFVPIAGVVGGLPFLAGFGIFRLGRRLTREAAEELDE